MLRSHETTTGGTEKKKGTRVSCGTVQTLVPNVFSIYRMPPKTLRHIIGEQTPGSWIAISLDRKTVVGLGISPEEAKLIAKARGEAQVILLRIPYRNVPQSISHSEKNECNMNLIS
jgi:hypothetical protein